MKKPSSNQVLRVPSEQTAIDYYIHNTASALERDPKSFKELLKKSKNSGIFSKFFETDRFAEILIERELLSSECLKILFHAIDSEYLLRKFSNNLLYYYGLENNCVSFKEVVDKYASFKTLNGSSVLYFLYEANDSLQYFIENSIVSSSDLKTLLKNAKDLNNVWRVFNNDFLISHCLENFIFEEALIKKYNDILIQKKTTFFEQAERSLKYTKYEDSMSYLKAYRSLRQFFDNSQDRKELLQILQKSKKSANLFLQILENNLLDQYSFVQLKSLLMKDAVKKKQKLNF